MISGNSVHNGDMDAAGGFTLENECRVEAEELGSGGDDDDADGGGGGAANAGGSVIEGGGVLCMNRRQTWTALVYLVRFVFPKLHLSLYHTLDF